MPSPSCEIREGAGAYAATTDGTDVTPAATITIHLISSAGVSTWSIQCITTDELSDAATVNAGLTIDSVAKTATFTAPAAGSAYRFQSIINGGIGVDGTAQASYSTTFCVYTLASGKRVHAVDETYESNSEFGWIADFNDFIRNPATFTAPTGTGFMTVTSGSMDAAALAYPLTVAKGGTGLTAPPGSTTEIIVNSGGTAYTSAANVKAGSGFVSIGSGTVNTTGAIRLPYAETDVVLGAKNSAAADCAILSRAAADTWQIGPDSASALSFSLRGNAVTMSPAASFLVQVNGVNSLRTDGTNVQLPLPISGWAFASLPFRFKSSTVSCGGGGTITLSDAEAECPYLDLTGAPGGAFTVEAPNTTNSTFNIFNNTGQTATLKKSGGTGVAIPTGHCAWYRHDGSDYTLRDIPKGITSPTISAPTITGAVVMTGFTTNTTTSADGKVVTIDALGSVETTDATVTSAYTSGTITDEAVHSAEVIVTAIKSDGTAAACYKRHYAGRRDGGTWTELAAVSDDKTEETSSPWDCTVDVSSNTFRVRVTGAGGTTIRWGVAIRMQSTVP